MAKIKSKKRPMIREVSLERCPGTLSGNAFLSILMLILILSTIALIMLGVING